MGGLEPVKIEATWDDRLRRFKYHIPGVAGFVTSDRATTSILSSTPALVREVKAIASSSGVKLPDQWELSIRR